MVMKLLREGAFGGFLKYVLMSLLALSVLGLVFMDVQGVLRGSVGGTDVASVGSQTISLTEFDTYARLSLDRYNMTPQEAYAKTQLFDDFLGALIRTRFVQQQADELGLTIGEKNVQQKLIGRIKPSQQDGESLQQTFERILNQQGLRERQFLESFGREILGDLLLEAIQSGFESTPEVSRDLLLAQNHTRDIQMLVFEDQEISGLEKPDAALIEKLYQSYKNTQFKVPELRTFELAYLDQEALKSTIEISESEISGYYENNIEEFKVPVQKVIEQTIIKDKDKAEKVKELVVSKQVSLEQAKSQVLGAEGMYIPPAPFREDMLIADLRDLVMSAKDGDVVGPVQSLLGYHVISVSKTIDSHTPPLKEVQQSIKEVLMTEKISDKLYELSDEMDDLISSGLNFKEVGETLPLRIVSLPAASKGGMDSEQKDVFQNVPEFDVKDRDIVLEEGFLIQSGETSRVFEFPSGHFGAIRLVDIRPESFKPLDEVKDVIVEEYIKDQQRAENNKRVDKILKSLEDRSKDLAGVARDTGKTIAAHDNISLMNPLPTPLKEDHKPFIFQAQVGQYFLLSFEGGRVICETNAFHLPSVTEDQEKQLLFIQSAVSKEIKDEVFSYYLYNLRNLYPVHRNELLLRKIYGTNSTESTNNQ